MSISAGVSKKVEDAYSTGALGPCSQFLVQYNLATNKQQYSVTIVVVPFSSSPKTSVQSSCSFTTRGFLPNENVKLTENESSYF